MYSRDVLSQLHTTIYLNIHPQYITIYPGCDADPIVIMMMHNIGFERQHCHMIMVSCCSITGHIGNVVAQQLECLQQ